MKADPEKVEKAKLEIAQLREKSLSGEIALLFEDETVMWRFALPRRGWFKREKRATIKTDKPKQSEIKKQESLKREQWKEHRKFSQISTGVLLYVIGAVCYSTNQVFSNVVASFDALGFKAFLERLMFRFKKEGKKVVVVVDNSKVHKARLVENFVEENKQWIELYFLPEHSGHLLNPIEPFWKELKTAVNGNQSYGTLNKLYRRTRHVLQRNHTIPIYHFPWIEKSA